MHTSPSILATAELESRLLDDVSVDLGWRLLERFSTLVRESGSPDEHAAAEWIAGELDRLGIAHEVYEPDLYLSLPRESRVIAEGLAEPIRAKPPSFSTSTEAAGLRGEMIHVPAAAVRNTDDLFKSHVEGVVPDVAGRVVLTEGYAMPLTVQLFESAGAMGQVYINPGENVHWGICTTIWGTPTDENLASKPATPVVAINRSDGDRLVELLEAAGGSLGVTLQVRLEEGWFPCKLPVARIEGTSDDFLLVHGHYDSWDVGIGDNAVGDATLLELARIFSAQRGHLKRSLWVAWWPAHSTGRYGGSTWFADRYALDLRKRCVAAVNIDSPGCWHATAYEEVMWMAEAGDLCGTAIADATGKEAIGRRPLRAGDYSFNQIGLTSFYMLLSNIPVEEREALGFYPTGGCGGNIAWHTEDDVMDVAVREPLERDLRVYVTSLARVLNADVLPFDFRATVAELERYLEEYAETAGGLLDLSPALQEARSLRAGLERLYDDIDRLCEVGQDASSDSVTVVDVNRVIIGLARILVPLSYAEGERFEHDPALPRVPIPKLSGIQRLAGVAETRPDELPFYQAGLKRRVNQVANALYEAAEVVRVRRARR